MKVCPQCDRTYHDDELNFCLMDGEPLAAGETQPTVVIAGGEPTVVETPRKTQVQTQRRSGLFWAGVWLASMITLVGAVIGGAFLFFLFTNDPSDDFASRRDSKPLPTPRTNASKPSASQTASPNPTISRPEPDGTPDASDADEEAIPITWHTTAATFGNEPGERFKFVCPADGKGGMVWGSDVYMTTSAICLAGVHAGAITLEEGGTVQIEYRPGRPAYGSTTRNGITTEPYGEYPSSFVILRAESKAAH